MDNCIWKGELTVKDSGSNGSITKRSTVNVLTGGKFILDGGTIDASDKGNGIWVENATFIMNGGKVKAKEFGVAYLKNLWLLLTMVLLKL